MKNELLTFMELLLSLPEGERNRVVNLFSLMLQQQEGKGIREQLENISSSDVEFFHHFARAAGY